ncbi:MAG: hypothetical protein ACK5NT_12720 [Pyrinomonadaceae bacterium]
MIYRIFAIAGASLITSLVFTFLTRTYARRRGFVAAPKADRWHKKPTAMLGGIAIYLTTIVISAAAVPYTKGKLVVLGGSTILFMVGLVDDFLNIKPYQKLIGQLIGTAFVIGMGFTLPWTHWEIVNIFITVFWLIGITNAINLLDNMDGLAAGISAIASLTLAIVLYSNGQTDELMLVSVFIGSLVGFLAFNFYPASIFMGDCGSMFVGFFLASSVMLNSTDGFYAGRSRGVFTVLVVPAMILLVPIFDTTFVTVLRKVSGRRASQGGRDHTSHRLVALGLSERSAVLMLYGLAIVAGFISFYIRDLQLTQSLALFALLTVVLVLVGVFLGKVRVYDDDEEELARNNNAAFGFLINLSYKRRIFEVLLDSLLITLAYYFSYSLLFPNFERTSTWDIFIQSLPLMVVIQLGAFLFVGVYRGIWRYTGINDFVTFFKGTVIGTAVGMIVLLFLYRFQSFSRGVFLLDGLLLFSAVSASRIAFRLFRQILPTPITEEHRRVLIYGAGDGGEMVFRELENNPKWEMSPVGFIDDDPLKQDKMIHGLKVCGGIRDIAQVCRDLNVEELLISVRNMDPENLKELRAVCREENIIIQRALIKIEPLEFD